MDQAELREWERKCIQEEVPRCAAACPLHVDVRGFCKLMSQRRWDKAWGVLARTLPLPGVIARLCDGPCMDACIRQEAGGSIRMDLLERYCAENARPVAPPRPLPDKGKHVAVLGNGLTALCAAWELGRKGFTVTLHCSVPGRSLVSRLPDGVLNRELASLEKLGVSIEPGTDLKPERVDRLVEEMDAVFLDSEGLPDLLGGESPDEITLGTARLGVFACGEEQSPIAQAATGRRAANSIERYVQGVSLVTGRELEGPYETRLFTSLTHVNSISPVAAEHGTFYSEANARDEAKRCLQCECMECVKGCEYLRHYKFYPKVYARQIYNNESIVMGTRQANTMINSCMLCGLCETICPEDFAMADICLQARRTMVERDHMPPSAHEFALRDMAFANGEKCALARHAPGMDTSEYLFFPGCQLTASDPEHVRSAYMHLRDKLGNIGLFLHCCGAPAEWSGREGLRDEAMAVLRSEWQRLGSPKLLVACPTCLKTLKQYLPEAEVTSYWTVLRVLGLPDGAQGGTNTLAVNDPCAARHDPALREDVRALLEGLAVTFVEPELSGELTQCCGYGGLLSEANPELGKRVRELRAESVAEEWVTYCAMCRDMFAKTGKSALHMFDLLFPRGEQAGKRPSPGYSERRENRAHLKEKLLSELWQESGSGTAEEYESLPVLFTENAQGAMEERRILKSDVQKVLVGYKNKGRAFRQEENGLLCASYRPVTVTYWVVFEEDGNGYLVHNVWSHRMKVREVRA